MAFGRRFNPNQGRVAFGSGATPEQRASQAPNATGSLFSGALTQSPQAPPSAPSAGQIPQPFGQALEGFAGGQFSGDLNGLIQQGLDGFNDLPNNFLGGANIFGQGGLQGLLQPGGPIAQALMKRRGGGIL